MINIYLFLVAVACCIFIALNNKKLKERLTWSLLFFILSATGFTVYILVIGDKPAPDSVDVTHEVLKKNGAAAKKMTKFTYYLLPATGSNIGEKEGTAKDILLDIPYLLNMPREARREGCGIIPPLEIMNEIFSKGIEDAGMSGGCKWQPFQINKNDFDEIVSVLS